MAHALIALHYQNDVCHPEGKIPFAIDRAGLAATNFLEASRKAIGRARHLGFMIALGAVVSSGRIRLRPGRRGERVKCDPKPRHSPCIALC